MIIRTTQERKERETRGLHIHMFVGMSASLTDHPWVSLHINKIVRQPVCATVRPAVRLEIYSSNTGCDDPDWLR